MEDGRVGHAELAIGDTVLMPAEEFPEIGHTAAAGGATIRVEVSDVDDSVARAVERGAGLLRPVRDSGQGRGGAIPVDDLDAALNRVRERGGRAGEVERRPYGHSADCVGNQGIEFRLWQQT
jgi:predicted enzyme related to lactoylglutathione lyase